MTYRKNAVPEIYEIACGNELALISSLDSKEIQNQSIVYLYLRHNQFMKMSPSRSAV